MTLEKQTHLDHKRALATSLDILEVSGPEARVFLQGLITNDMEKASPSQGLYAFLLTAQGKYLHDFFIRQTNDQAQEGFLLEVPTSQTPSLTKRLNLLKLRAQVDIKPRPDLRLVLTFPSSHAYGDFAVQGEALNDGRGHDLIRRHLVGEDSPLAKETNSDEKTMRHLLADQGIATPVLDFIPEKTTLMEAGMDGQAALSWTKGCFVGQELTARMKYRGLVKRLLVPFMKSDGVTAGETLFLDGKNVGQTQSDRFALIKLEAIEFEDIGFEADAKLKTETGQAIHLIRPQWWERAEASQKSGLA